MKRLNPETGNPFRRGDIGEDGKLFHGYNKTFIRKDGYFSEMWMSTDRFDEYTHGSRSKRVYNSDVSSVVQSKVRTNPITDKPYQIGDVCELGESCVVKIDHELIDHEGYAFIVFAPIEQSWSIIDKKLIGIIKNRISKAKARASKKDLPFNLTEGYLHAIFPKDCNCPALGLLFSLSTDNEIDNSDPVEKRELSPSLDRIKPELGYVEGNVAWISFKANKYVYEILT